MEDYTNFWKTNINDKIVYYGKKMLDISLQGFEGKDLLVNGEPKRLMVQSKTIYNIEGKRKKIIGQYQDFKHGDIIDYSDNKWLVTSFVLSDHQLYDEGTMEVCNDVLIIEVDATETIVGYDSVGRPIIEKVQGEPLIIDCITSNRIVNYEEGTGINLPDNRLEVTIPYTVHDKIIENTNFKMNNRNYKIIGLDYSGVINQIGIIKIIADRI